MTPSLSPPFSPTGDLSASAGQHGPPNVPAPVSPGGIQQQPQQSQQTVATVALGAVESLPTISRTRSHRVFLVADDIEAFVKTDLDVSRLNRIHGHLWMAGRPLNARNLQRQKMEGYDIILTEKADLHLLKFSNRLLVKPLPEYILDHAFYEKYICPSKELHRSACGFLLSYVWLICSPLDLKIAQQQDLLPYQITWPRWKAFVTDFLSNIDPNALDQVNERYHFGELRLGRINSIYRIRFFFTHFIRGYLYGYNRYVVFFERNFAWILVVFVYFSLVLSAMQVGASVPPLNDSHIFQRASYGFVVFSIVIVAFFLTLVGSVFASIFFFNMVAAIMHVRRERLERDEIARERDKGKEA